MDSESSWQSSRSGIKWSNTGYRQSPLPDRHSHGWVSRLSSTLLFAAPRRTKGIVQMPNISERMSTDTQLHYSTRGSTDEGYNKWNNGNFHGKQDINENSDSDDTNDNYGGMQTQHQNDDDDNGKHRPNWHGGFDISDEDEPSPQNYQQEQHQRRRLALIFGNNNYPSPHQLRSCRQDARDIRDKLESLGFDCTLVLDASQCTMISAEKSFRGKIRRGDCVLIFFSGHGMENKGKNYLVPIDKHSTPVDPVYDYICLDDIIKRLNEKKDIVNIIILDACRSDETNTTFRKSKSISHQEPAAYEKSMSNQIRVPDDAEYFIVYSCDPGLTSLAADFGKNSVFTAAFLKYIDQPGRTIEDVLKDVTKELRKTTNGRQRPWTNSCLTEWFCFNP